MTRVKQPVSIDGIEFDALINQSNEYEADVPAFPTEEGYYISDTVILKPETLNMTLFVTDTPVTWLHRNGGGYGHVDSIVSRLQQTYFERKVLTVVTSDAVYENMVITSMSLRKSADVGYAREIPIALKRVIITQSGVVQIPEDYGKSGGTNEAGNANLLNGEGSGPNGRGSILYNIAKSCGFVGKGDEPVVRVTDDSLYKGTDAQKQKKAKKEYVPERSIGGGGF